MTFTQLFLKYESIFPSYLYFLGKSIARSGISVNFVLFIVRGTRYIDIE